ncbi:MAG: sugar phosphate isomerase/epimerase family protein [Methanomicrobiales archaeon]|nr:sugar phosphate isomerase/epimerase family protein [Methanomicrobiales archaeon]
MSNRIFFSSSSKVWDSIEWVSGIEETGFDGWEIVADGSYRFDHQENFIAVREALGCLSLNATVHAPYSDLNLASLNHPIWRESVRQVCLCIERSSEFTELVTFHPGYLSPLGKLMPSRAWESQREALIEIGRCAEEVGVKACMENMGGPREFLCRRPEEMLGTVDGIDGVGLTFDLGHANMEGRVRDFLQVLGHASHLHLHDNHGLNDEHLPIGEGNIDWDYAGRMVRSAYAHIIVVEGRSLVDGGRSLKAIKGWFR